MPADANQNADAVPMSFTEIQSNALPADRKLRQQATNRLATYEDCEQAIDALLRAAVASKGNEAFLEFLEFARRFQHMALFNVMMVLVQRPGCDLAATRVQWAAVGRRPLPDAVPIVTLRPFGPLSFVYDVADTNGRPLPRGNHSFFTAKGDLSPSELKRAYEAAEDSYVQVEETDHYGGSRAGTAAAMDVMPGHSDNPRFRWRVRVNSRHPPAVRFATLAHELGHIYCGHQGRHPDFEWPARLGLSHAQREIEAEAVCWLVCQRRGIEPNAPEYLRNLVHQHPVLDAVSLWTIVQAANRIESGPSGKRKRATAEPKPS